MRGTGGTRGGGARGLGGRRAGGGGGGRRSGTHAADRGDAAEALVIPTQKCEAQKARAGALQSVGEIVEGRERFFAGAEKNVARQERRVGRGTVRFHLQQDEAEGFGAGAGARHPYWRDDYAEPGVDGAGSEETCDGVAGHGER